MASDRVFRMIKTVRFDHVHFASSRTASYALVAVVVYAKTAASYVFSLSKPLFNLPVGIADLYGARRIVVEVARRDLQIGDFSHKRGQQGSLPAFATLMSAAAVNPCQQPGEPLSVLVCLAFLLSTSLLTSPFLCCIMSPPAWLRKAA